MQFLTAAEIDAALTFPDLIAALADAFRSDAAAPKRHHHTLPRPEGDATLLLMPAWTQGEAASMGVKIVTVFPANARRSLATVLGTYILMDGETGRPLVAMDGTRLTLWRTAAASALAASSLARPDASHLTMVGAGALAPFLIRAHMAVRPIERVTIWNHRPERAATLAQELATLKIPIRATTDLGGAVAAADIISCATLSTVPLVKGSWLKSGAHLDLVGAFAPGMREADDEAIERATVFVDTPAALTEGGDIQGALARGVIAESRVAGDLSSLAKGYARGRASPEEITLFKSVGAAVEDLAAAQLVWRERTA